MLNRKYETNTVTKSHFHFTSREHIFKIRNKLLDELSNFITRNCRAGARKVKRQESMREETPLEIYGFISSSVISVAGAKIKSFPPSRSLISVVQIGSCFILLGFRLGARIIRRIISVYIIIFERTKEIFVRKPN